MAMSLQAMASFWSDSEAMRQPSGGKARKTSGRERAAPWGFVIGCGVLPFAGSTPMFGRHAADFGPAFLPTIRRLIAD